MRRKNKKEMVAQGMKLDNAKRSVLNSFNEERCSSKILGENIMRDPKIEKFKKVLKMDPNDETLWFGLGKAYMGDENW